MGLDAEVAGAHATPQDQEWSGGSRRYEVGDPGRAPSMVVPVPDPAVWDRPDTVLDDVALVDESRRPIVELRAASVRGLSHRSAGTVRQDEYGFRRTADGRYLVMCVADGVSAGSLSHHAAVVAAGIGLRGLAGHVTRHGVDDIPWRSFLEAVAAKIEQRGRQHLAKRGTPDVDGMSVRAVADHLATTVLYAVLDLRAVDGEHRVDMVSVGDTSGWVVREGGVWEPQQPVKNDGADVYSPSVRALPLVSDRDPVPMRTTVRAGEALVLMTDGVGDPLGRGTGVVGRFLADVWRKPPTGLDFAGQVGFSRKTFDDDRTVIAVWPVPRP